jgi:hypothetical protein
MDARTKSSTLHISSIRFWISVPVKAKQLAHWIFLRAKVRLALGCFKRCASSATTVLR